MHQSVYTSVYWVCLELIIVNVKQGLGHLASLEIFVGCCESDASE